jgi:hypothetical protein
MEFLKVLVLVTDFSFLNVNDVLHLTQDRIIMYAGDTSVLNTGQDKTEECRLLDCGAV